MTRSPSLLRASSPTTVASATVYIGHPQLRDLIICPRDRGIVNYVQKQSIVEHDIHDPTSEPREIAALTFVPNTLAYLPIEGTSDTLIAAGGQDADLHISLHSPSSSSASSSTSAARPTRPLLHSSRGSIARTDLSWQFEAVLTGSINNSVLLTSLNLTRSHESSVEPRVGVSNNDHTIRFYDVPVRGAGAPRTIKEVGTLQMAVPVNHSSISPDGQTLLSVGDSSEAYLYSVSGGSRIMFTPISTLAIPPSSSSSTSRSYTTTYPYTSIAASFSSSFSSDGMKFAVASQEGVVVVWDVRSSKPLKIFESDRNRAARGTAEASGWINGDPYEWTLSGNLWPGWGFRSVKFSPPGSGKDIMTFTEHTSLVHVVDGCTFETEEVVRMPTVRARTPLPPPSPSSSRTTSQRPLVTPLFQPQAQQVRPRPVRIALTSRPPPPPRVVLALEDTFRIPSTSASSRRRQDRDDLVVIPSFGDRAVEDHVQALLGRHGTGVSFAVDGLGLGAEGGEGDDNREAAAEDTEMRDARGEGGARGEDDMEEDEGAGGEAEVDELEPDCLSSHTPSRAGSPVPSSGAHSHAPTRRSRRAGSATSTAAARLQRRVRVREEKDLDLAGVCFNPTGEWLYTASVGGVAEWSVRGAEKRWWAGGAWA